MVRTTHNGKFWRPCKSFLFMGPIHGKGRTVSAQIAAGGSMMSGMCADMHARMLISFKFCVDPCV